jgi:hypothetical protein
MGKVQKPSNSVCYTPSSEPFRIYFCSNLLLPSFTLNKTHYAWALFLLPAKTELWPSPFTSNTTTRPPKTLKAYPGTTRNRKAIQVRKDAYNYETLYWSSCFGGRSYEGDIEFHWRLLPCAKPCSLVDSAHHFEGTWCGLLQGRKASYIQNFGNNLPEYTAPHSRRM